jgi:hypothetical protein
LCTASSAGLPSLKLGQVAGGVLARLRREAALEGDAETPMLSQLQPQGRRFRTAREISRC